MSEIESIRVSVKDVAKAAGVSKATACYVLRNRPGPSQATRERVLGAAKQLGYVPDPRMVSWMAKVRDAKAKELLPIAWLDTNWEKDSWHRYKFFSPYLEGAQERARQMGYRIEEIWAAQPGMTMRRVSQILYQRGIEGVIVTQQVKHIRLNWDYLAAVSLETGLLAPRLHRVHTDVYFNLLLALKVVKRFGYRRIGMCLADTFGRYSNQSAAAIELFLSTTPPKERVLPLFYSWARIEGAHMLVEKEIVDWVKREQPDVIVGHNGYIVEYLTRGGYRVPQDIGVVHIATDDDVSDWAGICSNRREIGAAAAERVISLVQNRQFGIPKTAVSMVIRGTWHNGSTLLTPKPRSLGQKK